MEEGRKEDELLNLLEQELMFSFSRSSGPGGQHANKVSTRVELKFPVVTSAYLSEEQKLLIQRKLVNRISAEGFLLLSAQDERSQKRNKELVIEKFRELIANALKPEKKRIPTRPSPQLKEMRLTEKRKTSEKKQARKKPGQDDLV